MVELLVGLGSGAAGSTAYLALGRDGNGSFLGTFEKRKEKSVRPEDWAVCGPDEAAPQAKVRLDQPWRTISSRGSKLCDAYLTWSWG